MRHHGAILYCIAAAMGASKPVHQFELPERFVAVTHQINQLCVLVRRGPSFESLRNRLRCKEEDAQDGASRSPGGEQPFQPRDALGHGG
jgi:hypothetical protein